MVAIVKKLSKKSHKRFYMLFLNKFFAGGESNEEPPVQRRRGECEQTKPGFLPSRDGQY
jgi:hypothetical protein